MARARNFVEVELAETGVRVIGVHLSAGLSGRGERRRLPEINRVLQVADAPPGAGRTLIAGDLNAVAPGDLSAVARLPAWIRLLLRVDGGIGTTVVARVLGEGYTDAYRRLNPDVVGPTMPAAAPSVRLDYLMLGAGPRAGAGRLRARRPRAVAAVGRVGPPPARRRPRPVRDVKGPDRRSIGPRSTAAGPEAGRQRRARRR